MIIAEIIGKVTLSKSHPSLRGARWLLGVSLDRAALAGDENAGRGEPFVIYDELGAGGGSRIAVSEGAEAAAPFSPEVKPIDAYNAALLDHVEVDS